MKNNWGRYCPAAPTMSRRMFTALAGLCCALPSCGGGGGGDAAPSTATVWQPVPDLLIDRNQRRISIDATDAQGHNVGAGVFRFRFTMRSRGYWAALVNGNPLQRSHFAVITRSDNHRTGPWGGEIWGAGLAIGALGVLGDGRDLGLQPRLMMESWRTLSETDRNLLYADTQSAVLQDGPAYDVELWNWVDLQGKRWLRYRAALEGATVADFAHEDSNTTYDTTMTGLVVADAFNPDGGWTVEISNAACAWEAYGGAQ